MANWFWPERRSSHDQISAPRATFEALEERRLMAAPVISNITDQAVPAGRSIIIPVRGADADGDRLTYTVKSKSDDVVARLYASKNPWIQMNVAGKGTMTFELFRDVAPVTVGRITGLVQAGYFDGLTFHRIADLLGGGSGFIVQGGDPLGTGGGGPEDAANDPGDWFAFDDEFSPTALFTGRGQLAMANSGDDTNGSQFFITDGAVRHLDFNHTIFGQLVRGQEVLADLVDTPTNGSGTPTTPLTISSVRLVRNKRDAVLNVRVKGALSSPAQVVVRASDGTSLDTEKFNVSTVANTANAGPYMSSIEDVATPRGRAVRIPVNIVDLEGGPTQLDLFFADRGGRTTPDIADKVSLTYENGILTATPINNFRGTVVVDLRIADAQHTQFPDGEVFRIAVGDKPIRASGLSAAVAANDKTKWLKLASFTDTDRAGTANEYTAEILWGDGTRSTGSVISAGDGRFEVLGRHDYDEAGSYMTTVRIVGTKGARDETHGTVTVS